MRTAIALSMAAMAALTNMGTVDAANPYNYYSIQRQYQPRIQQRVQPINRQRINYKFGARMHLDTLVVRLHDQANEVCWEMYLNHQHEASFRATYAEMYKILQDLKHIHELSHEDAVHNHGPGNEDHIAHDLHDIDQLFHLIEEDIDNWGLANHWDRNPYHRHGSRLDIKMRRFEQTLHHLMRDYGVTSRVGVKQGFPPIPNQGAPAPLNNGSPGNALPTNTLPGNALPGDTFPGNGLPGTTIPGNNVPLSTQPLLP